jgi:hypothetical protein
LRGAFNSTALLGLSSITGALVLVTALIIIGGSLVFHLIYDALTGFISGRIAEIGIFIKIKNNTIVKP